MILFEIHSNRPVILPLEGDTPRSVDMNRVANRLASKRMKIKTRKVHITWNPGSIQSVKPSSASLLKVETDLRRFASLEELSQASMPEAPDHGHM
jgi:hypothetical protein